MSGLAARLLSRETWTGTPAGWIVGGGLVLAVAAGAIAAGGDSPWGSDRFFGALLVWGGVSLSFAALTLLSRVLRHGGAVGAVARVLVAEVVRRRVLAITTVLLFLALATVSSLLAENRMVEHRLESLVAYSLFITFTILSLMTLFVSAGSLAEEIDDRRIHSVVVKPVGRARFLLGKWVGVVAIDTVLLALAGGAIILSFERTLSIARERGDDVAAAERLRIAHRAVGPERSEELVARAKERADERRREDPHLWNILVAETGGDEESALLEFRRSAYRDLLAQWVTIPVGERRTYRFPVGEIDAGGSSGTDLALHLAPQFAFRHSSERQRLLVTVAGETTSIFLGGEESRVLLVPASAVVEGSVSVEVENADLGGRGQPASFIGKDRLAIEVPRGSFRTNLLCGLAIFLAQLSFIAALGTVAATFLGLPVAVLLSSLVLFAAAAGGAVVELGDDPEKSALERALEVEAEHDHSGHDHSGHDHDHGHAHSHDPWQHASPFVRFLDESGRRFIGLFRAWGKAAPIESVAAGREIATDTFVGVLWRIGLAWTGAVAAIGACIFSRREIARVQV